MAPPTCFQSKQPSRPASRKCLPSANDEQDRTSIPMSPTQTYLSKILTNPPSLITLASFKSELRCKSSLLASNKRGTKVLRRWKTAAGLASSLEKIIESTGRTLHCIVWKGLIKYLLCWGSVYFLWIQVITFDIDMLSWNQTPCTVSCFEKCRYTKTHNQILYIKAQSFRNFPMLQNCQICQKQRQNPSKLGATNPFSLRFFGATKVLGSHAMRHGLPWVKSELPVNPELVDAKRCENICKNLDLQK